MKIKSFKQDDFDTLLKNATSPKSDKRDRLLLWFWCQRHAPPEDFDGEGYKITFDKRIYPVFKMVKDFDCDVIGNIIVDAVIQ